MTTQRAFLMVWDGLRPDLVSPDLTPNLWRLAEDGVSFERSRAVFPTLTRANSPAISTGCRPGKAGVPGNTFLLRSTEGAYETHSSGDVASLERLSQADSQPVLLVDTLADRVHRTGGRTVVVGSGSPGSAWLQHPRALEVDDVVIVDGLTAMRGFMQALRQRFGPLPNRHAVPATAWTAYFTRVITEFVLPELQPTLLIFWHTDPDHTAHAGGYFAPETAQSLRDADANLGAILRAFDALGMRDTTAVAVTSDHGGSTITRRAQPSHDLSMPVAENGGSVFAYSSDPQLPAMIRQFDYVGPLFTRDGRDNTFPLSLVGLDGPRAPDAVFSFTWTSDVVQGVPGTAIGSNSKLVMDHGSISPFDLHNTLVLHGPDFRRGIRSAAPVGNIDVTPTLAHVLGLDIGHVDGRVISEAIVGGLEPTSDTWEEQRQFTARGRAWRQRVWFDRTGATSYLAGGSIEAL